MRARRLVSGLMALLVLGLSGGCTPIGINQEAIVLAVAVDPAPDGYVWTFMLPNPTVTPSSEAELHNTSEYFTVHVEATSFGTAVHRVQAKLDRYLFLGLCQVVVLNPRLPGSVITTVITTLVRDGRFSPRAWVTFGLPSAAALLKTSSPQESIPTVYLAAYFSCKRCHSPELQTRVWQAWDDLVLPSATATIPLARMSGGELTVNRAVWICQRRVVPLNREETEGWALLDNRWGQGVVTVREASGPVGVHPIHLTAAVKLLAAQRLEVRLVGTGSVEEAPPLDAAGGDRIERGVAQAILAEVTAAIRLMQRAHVDPLGLGTEESLVTGREGAPVVPGTVIVRLRLRIVPSGRVL